MEAFAYANPATLKEALALLGASWGEAEVLAGGTDLLELMKQYLHTPKRVVDLKGIAELGGIRKAGGGVRIGALATFDELLESPLLREYPALLKAAEGVASPQIRNRGTAGGDLCQRPRCWYFRNGFGPLAKEVADGENRYHAIFGNQGAAKFVSASSLGPPLAALGARIQIASASGRREVEAARFFVTPQRPEERETVLKPGEIVTEIVVPAARGVRNTTYEVRQKQSLDWPLATASVALSVRGDKVGSARVVLGHVAPVPFVAAKAAEVLSGKTLTEETIQQASEAAVSEATPLSQNAYKVQLARTAVKRALLAARG